ncbi:MAG: DNA-3-methyladenine glycosylase [Pirellulales bacterium]
MPKLKEHTGKRLGRQFFRQSAIEVSSQLLGAIMVRRVGGTIRRARVVEVEAYLGPRDLASHSARGRTRRTEVMFGPAGHAYVYFIYGMHWMFNIVVGTTGEAEAILLRAAEPLDDWDANLIGPANLAKSFRITGADNGDDITTGDNIHFLRDGKYTPRLVRGKRIGIAYAKHWQHRHLRFIDGANRVAGKLRS